MRGCKDHDPAPMTAQEARTLAKRAILDMRTPKITKDESNGNMDIEIEKAVSIARKIVSLSERISDIEDIITGITKLEGKKKCSLCLRMLFWWRRNYVV